MPKPDRFWGAVIASMVGSALLTPLTLLLTPLGGDTSWGAVIVALVMVIILFIGLIILNVINAARQVVKERLQLLFRGDPPPPRPNLPYVYREKYEKKVKKAFDNPETSVIIICGIAGIGKSTLVGYFLSVLASWVEGDYVFQRRFSCKGVLTLESVIADLVSRPEFGGHYRLIVQGSRTTQEKVSSLVEALEVTGPDVLFFDDYHEADKDLDEFVQHVAQDKKIQLFLASREELEQFNNSAGVETIPLDEGLPLDDAKDLLRDRSRALRNQRDVVMDEIWRKCDEGHPWALLAFAQLSEEKSVKELLTDLPDFDVQDNNRYWQRMLFSQLSPTEGELALAFSLLRKPLPGEALRNHLCELYPHPNRKEALDGLLRREFIYEQQVDIYVMHDLFRKFCIEELEHRRFAQHRRDVHRRAAQFYLSLQTDREAERVEWQLEAWEHYTEASEHRVAASLAIEIAETLRRQLRYQEVLDLREKTREHGISSPGLETHYIQILKHTKGEYEKAKAHAQGLCKSGGDLSRAWGLETLASFYADESDYEQALKDSRESFRIFSRLYDTCQVDEVRRELKLGQGKAKKTEGFTLRQMGYCELAVPVLKDALAMQRELDPCINEGTRELADCYMVGDEPKKALEVIDEAIQRLGNPTPPAYSTSKARILQAQGDFGGAWQMFENALEVAREKDDPSNESGALWAKGDWYLKKGEYDLALEAYDFPLERCKEWRWLRKEALIRHSKALALEGKGNLSEAYKELRKAIEIFEGLEPTRDFLRQAYPNSEEVGATTDLKSARRDLEHVESQIIQKAREAGYPIPENPNRAVSKTFEAKGLLRYPSEIPEAGTYISDRINSSDDQFPGFNYGTFVVTQEGDIAFAKLRYGPKNTEKVLVEGKLVNVRVGGLHREAQVLTELAEQGYETPSLLAYYPETPEGAEPDRANTLETLVIEAIPPQEGSTLPPEKWTPELARLAAQKIKTFTISTSEIPLYQDEKRSLPLDILKRRARLSANSDYESALKKVVEEYEHLDEPIMVHGDTWLNNIIVKYDNSDVLFVDWELSGPGYKGQDAGRTLWGLTLDKNWGFVDAKDTARAFINEWSQTEDEKNSLRFGIIFESLRWIADRQDRLQEPTLDTESKQRIVSKIEYIKTHTFKLLDQAPKS